MKKRDLHWVKMCGGWVLEGSLWTHLNASCNVNFFSCCALCTYSLSYGPDGNTSVQAGTRGGTAFPIVTA